MPPTEPTVPLTENARGRKPTVVFSNGKGKTRNDLDTPDSYRRPQDEEHDSGMPRTGDVDQQKLGCLARLSYNVSTAIGQSFYRLGRHIAQNPWRTILVSWIIVACCSLGFLRFHKEKSPMKLWIPQNSKFLHDTNWLIEHFKEGNRIETAMLTAPDVLTPEVLQQLAAITEDIVAQKALDSTGKTYTWKDVCFKVPLIAEYTANSRRKRDDSSVNSTTTSPKHSKKPKPFFNPSVNLPSFMYCPMIERLPIGCMEFSILELWKYDRQVIAQLTKEQIVDKLNKTKISPVTGHTVDYSELLGGVERDWSGRIVSATSLMSNWMLHVNYSEVDHDVSGNIAGTEDWVTEAALAWEAAFLEKMHKIKENYTQGDTNLYYAAGRSYGDISADSMFKDIDKLVIGGVLMFIYMQLVLSKFSCTEFRVILGSIGLLSIGMGFVAGCGIIATLGVSYGPVHTSLPFLLMGLGVDDMFVMMAGYRKIRETHSHLPLPEQMGLMLKHAGASITVTSLTDLVAFAVGSITVLPSLQSFCIYAAAGVLMMYFFAITFYVAIFTLDEQRIAARRNSFAPWIVHSEKSTKLWCQKHLMHRFINAVYSKCILTKPGKVLIIAAVIVMTGLNVQSLLKLRQKFDPNWFIPEDTYFNEFIVKTKENYPNVGYEAMLLFGDYNYTAHLKDLLQLTNELENRTDILHSISSWVVPFQDFVHTYYDEDIGEVVLSDKHFRDYLSKFLFSHDGGRYQVNFKFDSKLTCGKPAPNITVSIIQFKFRPFKEREEYLPAKHAVEEMLAGNHIATGDQFKTLWAKIFGNWVTDEIIDTEIYRNIAIAMVGVMICSVVLIVNPQICFWIFVCVLLTLVNVGGFMQRWGLTLDLVSCIALQLAVGLCVDYSAHIGHTFLTINHGNRNQRALETVLHIGAAVLNGGGSTILALSVLSGSQAYTYRTFFKIFLLVILIGLFNGLVLLPVILSQVGPAPYSGFLDNPSKLYSDYEKEMLPFTDDQKQLSRTNGKFAHSEEERQPMKEPHVP
ncbi:NPC intracellular cholesterol transporter 1-like [Topomyia yanbarensis]|uniref:NPC intracellular cholesterol transporter 1-like n=1 Tax=Topomyia yanbarensis TaxID=2498891 RepID=UPI00273B5D1F|nr:NPC intracellular cholesterol transporter 1-like [Topomyia yanbarensis]XP_058824385.1 NPC intracellular cholesterol transporter 1-like [Topomyia yanbarensis]XP_058824386.1 NPC intracellular cholesterol transporter 1-like [Topomyia yanbarensis]XP_058824387.1 NPC intracellular cholesterol transporter 1-like [Topomyia yanbarensis]XP_058824388.1 NPC intracellular cholesterol transporter 1-like [Topomyia yanbarensis]XP_058824389.1 NPC intracellular cholesterol transporter 1-like [Topomyia yanbar